MDEIEKLKEEIEDLKTRLIDLLFESNYSKEKELLNYLRDLYESVKSPDLKKLSKKEIIKNLKDSIEEFAKNNRLAL